MIAVVETTKSALEIYQPLIVGLGAVVIGFLANSLLEWWKSNLARASQRDDIRKAIYVDLKGSIESITQATNYLAENPDISRKMVFRLPINLMEFDLKEIGLLGREEVTALADVISFCRASLTLDEFETRNGDIIWIEITDKNREYIANVLVQISVAGEEALRILSEKFR